jgi:type VI secretion system protein VasD
MICTARVALGAVVLAALCAGGCATAECPPPSMKLSLQAAERLNPDDQGRALSTVVRIYQLKSIVKLEHAEFEDVWLRASETLGGDLLKSDEFTLFPKDSVDQPLTLEKETSFVVAVALFRKPGGLSWRSIYEMPEKKCTLLGKPKEVAHRFALEDYRIEAGSNP